MARTYTAKEMREFADAIAGDLNERGHTSVKYTFDDLIPVIESLRQAADAMEREEKREYEYTAEYVKRRSGDVVCKCVYHFNSFDKAKRFKYYPLKGEKLRFIRREVGEWEEVRDEKL